MLDSVFLYVVPSHMKVVQISDLVKVSVKLWPIVNSLAVHDFCYNGHNTD